MFIYSNAQNGLAAASFWHSGACVYDDDVFIVGVHDVFHHSGMQMYPGGGMLFGKLAANPRINIAVVMHKATVTSSDPLMLRLEYPRRAYRASGSCFSDALVPVQEGNGLYPVPAFPTECAAPKR